MADTSTPAPVLDVPATLAALQDQIDDLVAVIQAQQRALDALTPAPHRPHPDGL